MLTSLKLKLYSYSGKPASKLYKFLIKIGSYKTDTHLLIFTLNLLPIGNK